MYCNPAITLLANHLTPKSCFPLLHLPGGMHLPISQCCCARQMNLFISLKFFLVKFYLHVAQNSKDMKCMFLLLVQPNHSFFFPDLPVSYLFFQRSFIHI